MIKFKQYITEMIHGKTEGLFSERENFSKPFHESHYNIKPVYHEALDDYTSYSYELINNILNTPNRHKPKEIHSSIKHLDSVTTSHEAPHDFHVYSGIKFDPSEGKEHKEPFKAHIKQFTSASLLPTVARKYSVIDKSKINNKVYNKHLLKIHIPKGSKHGAYIAKYSTFEHEKEFLMKRNLKLKIHHEPEIQEDSGDNYHIWHANIEE